MQGCSVRDTVRGTSSPRMNPGASAPQDPVKHGETRIRCEADCHSYENEGRSKSRVGAIYSPESSIDAEKHHGKKEQEDSGWKVKS